MLFKLKIYKSINDFVIDNSVNELELKNLNSLSVHLANYFLLKDTTYKKIKIKQTGIETADLIIIFDNEYVYVYKNIPMIGGLLTSY